MGAEQAERYDEMADYMGEVGNIPQELSVEERKLTDVKQFYTQNGKTIEHPSYTVNGNQHMTITDDFCKDWVAETQESLMIQAGRLCRFLSMYKERPGLSIGRLNGAGRWWVALSVHCAPEWTDGKLGVFIKDGFLILVLIGFSKLCWLSLAGL